MSQRSSRWLPEDDDLPPEPTFARKIAEDLWDNSLTLVVWSIGLWTVTIISFAFFGALVGPLSPIVLAFTFAPGLAGLMVAFGKAAQGSFARLGDVARGTIRLYWRSVALASPLVASLSLVVITTSVLDRFPERNEMIISWGLQVGLSLVLATLHIYMFPVLALYDTPLKKTVQVAMWLIGRFVRQTLALMALGVVLLVLPMLHTLIWLLVPCVWCVVVMNATWRMTRDTSLAKSE